MKEVIRLFSGLLLLAVCLSQWPHTEKNEYKTDIELLKAIAGISSISKQEQHTPIRMSAAIASNPYRPKTHSSIEPINFAYARLGDDFVYTEPQTP